MDSKITTQNAENVISLTSDVKTMPKKQTTKKTTPKIGTTPSSIASKPQTVKMSPINHFEIPFVNLDKIKDFYGSIFGWTFMSMPEMDYTMVNTTEVDEKQTPITPGAVNGGLTKRTKDQVSPTLVITVQSIEKASEQIKTKGGQLLGETSKVGDMGLYQLFKDPDGNTLGIYQRLRQQRS